MNNIEIKPDNVFYNTCIIGRNTGCNLSKNTHNFFIGENCGNSVINGDNNIIIGDNIEGKDIDNQFIIGDVKLFNTTDKAFFMHKAIYENYPIIMACLSTHLDRLSLCEKKKLLKKMIDLRDGISSFDSLLLENSFFRI